MHQNSIEDRCTTKIYQVGIKLIEQRFFLLSFEKHRITTIDPWVTLHELSFCFCEHLLSKPQLDKPASIITLLYKSSHHDTSRHSLCSSVH